jgi:hypothetical protein
LGLCLQTTGVAGRSCSACTHGFWKKRSDGTTGTLDLVQCATGDVGREKHCALRGECFYKPCATLGCVWMFLRHGNAQISVTTQLFHDQEIEGLEVQIVTELDIFECLY